MKDASPFIRKLFFRSTLVAGVQQYGEDGPIEHSAQGFYNFAGKRLLVVEDNELNMEIVCELLKEYGFATESASNGKEGVKRFAGSRPGYFDAVLMDVLMPVMDGLTAAREIRRLQRGDARTVPIIALSANAFDEDRRKSLESGMNAHISKLLDMDTLCRVLRSCFERGDGKGERGNPL